MNALPQAAIASAGPCRLCGSPLTESVIDLGCVPSANAYLRPEDLDREEPTFPLHVYVCGACCLVQLQQFHTPEELFSNYAYFSSYSESWVRHAENYCEAMTERFRLGPESRVIEIASNDGYLLQSFKKSNIPVLGIEPAANVAEAARDKGIDTLVRFFGNTLARELAASGQRADLLVGNNVLAHVPDLNDFVMGLRTVLQPSGILTLEFPHLQRMLAQTQFDTIYHEHFSYFSLLTAERVLARHGLAIFDAEELPTHGGSLRIFAGHADRPRLVTDRLFALRRSEREAGLDRLETYRTFGRKAADARNELRRFFDRTKENKQTVVGYGAPAKGNTLLNFCGIGADDIAYTVDASPHKQGRFLPGTHVPIHHPDKIRDTKPDFVLILPWNLKNEIRAQLDFVREWGGRFVVPIPAVQVME